MCKDIFNILLRNNNACALFHPTLMQRPVVSISERFAFHARTSLVQAASAL